MFLIHDQVKSVIFLILYSSKYSHDWKLIMTNYSKQIRAERERFRKRRKSLFKKMNEFSFLCHTDFYFVMYQSGKYYIYSSTKKQGWPSSQKDLIWQPYFFSLLLIAQKDNNHSFCDYQTFSNFKSLVKNKIVNSLSMKNRCILSRESNIKEQTQSNEKMIHKIYQHITIKESENIVEKNHIIRSFIIPKPSKLTIISWSNFLCLNLQWHEAHSFI